ncbi:MAG TPA: symmetrical bis(5'-nucleosyl)-tetraphosphatase [Rhodocyclaceae bacterium]|nr:symmetrical bis(5'-nucleosyl)-tetraphosphatase [Rhodocyclaceae bacterium]
MATYAIGDIQGCYAELCDLLEKIAFNPAHDRLWLVGDLVNRGPASLETLRYIKGLGDRATVVLGNHDLHLIMRAEGFGRDSKQDTIAPILAAPDRDELTTWLRHCPLFHVEGEFAMVHAGVLPQWSIEKAQALATEVSTMLSKKKKYVDFLANMWGSQPAGWDDHLEDWPRLRVIVNAMTRMRFCSPDGVMEFCSKGSPNEPPAGYLPWFAIPDRASLTHTMVCGHWSALGLRVEDKLLALDSGCLWGGQLTAVRLEDRHVFQVPSRQPASPWAGD